MIWHLPTCLALHHTNVNSTRAMLAFCPAPKTYSLFPTLEKSLHPTHVIFSQSFLGFSFNITSLSTLPLIVQSILPLSYICFHRSFIEIITYLLKYIIHLMLVSVSRIQAGRALVLAYKNKVLTTVLYTQQFLNKYTFNEFIDYMHFLSQRDHSLDNSKIRKLLYKSIFA